MGFTLEKIVSWRRSHGEYIGMFGLTETDLGFPIPGYRVLDECICIKYVRADRLIQAIEGRSIAWKLSPVS